MKALGLTVPIVALVMGVAAGVGGAILMSPDETNEQVEGAWDGPVPPPEPTPGEPAEYADLGNQFVVPVLRDGEVRALVLVSITLEVSEGTTGQVFALEPRLRDAFLRVLFDHANAGGFDDRFTQSDRMSLLRQGLREAAHRLLGPMLRDVLIVDIVRQEA
jgi:flagellar basal body-associated protein FliL